jgi:hypothetical protein
MLITLLYFIQFFNAKARVDQEHEVHVLIFFSSSYYLPKKEKYTKKWIALFTFFLLVLFFLYFYSWGWEEISIERKLRNDLREIYTDIYVLHSVHRIKVLVVLLVLSN